MSVVQLSEGNQGTVEIYTLHVSITIYSTNMSLPKMQAESSVHTYSYIITFNMKVYYERYNHI